MAEKFKVESDAAPLKAAGTRGMAQWRQNWQKSRAVVPTKTPQGVLPSNPKVNGMCNVIKGRGLVFNSSDPQADRFTHVKRDIYECIGKEYTNGGDVWWMVEK